MVTFPISPTSIITGLASFGFLAIGSIFIWILIIILLAVFWLWMLINVLGRKDFNDKLVYVVIMLLLGVIGSVIYYFVVYSKDPKHSKILRYIGLLLLISFGLLLLSFV